MNTDQQPVSRSILIEGELRKVTKLFQMLLRSID